MIGNRVRRTPSPAVTVDDGGIRPPAPHARIGRLVRVVSGATLVAVIVVLGAGVVGNPWYHFVSVEGGSMEPAISNGDLVVVAPAPAKVEPGMILVLTVDGQVVTHRVVAVNLDGTLITRGDANPVDDSWSGQQVQVDGQYVATIPWLGHILQVGDVSDASYADDVSAGAQISVGAWSTPSPTVSPEGAGSKADPSVPSLEPSAPPPDASPAPLSASLAPGPSAPPGPSSSPADATDNP